MPRFKGNEMIPAFVTYGNAKLVTAGGFALLAVMSVVSFFVNIIDSSALYWLADFAMYACEAIVMVGFIAMYFTRDNIFDLGAAAGVGISLAVYFIAGFIFRTSVPTFITIICGIILYGSLAAKKLKGGDYMILALIAVAFLFDVIVLPLIGSAVRNAYMGMKEPGFFTYHLVSSRWVYPFVIMLVNIACYGVCALTCLDSSEEE
ncbi:MAG: hypothetical protein IJ454_00190 [Clostridia bacterium]|nr:hypothetical protein [Clostridia bacterium]